MHPNNLPEGIFSSIYLLIWKSEWILSENIDLYIQYRHYITTYLFPYVLYILMYNINKKIYQFISLYFEYLHICVIWMHTATTTTTQSNNNLFIHNRKQVCDIHKSCKNWKKNAKINFIHCDFFFIWIFAKKKPKKIYFPIQHPLGILDEVKVRVDEWIIDDLLSLYLFFFFFFARAHIKHIHDMYHYCTIALNFKIWMDPFIFFLFSCTSNEHLFIYLIAGNTTTWMNKHVNIINKTTLYICRIK